MTEYEKMHSGMIYDCLTAELMLQFLNEFDFYGGQNHVQGNKNEQGYS